ncbi:MAG: SDR family NAD(P)-dependent oxidoreductase [Nitrospirales bacterium]|jgi:nucleoside-diphosphate-sugar epimerase|nr:MAG: SDR family NAD(P)-dependent oxidoreductase [Nitrospirales bacterium]
MKALVTGATGFIGSHLCGELVKKGYDVTCLVKKTSNLKWIENLNIDFVHGDCTEKNSLLDAVSNCDYVFHLAGLTKARSGDEFFAVNTKGTENLVKAVAERNPTVKRFVYVSSLAAAGPCKNGVAATENCSACPVSDYGRSKLEGEKAVLQHRDLIPVTIVRPPAVYGPRDRDMLVLFKMIKKGVYFDLGTCYYSLLYVDDLVQGIILCAESKKAEGQIYFLSDIGVVSGKDIAGEISSALNVKPVPLKVPKFAMSFFAFIGEKMNKQGIINRDRMKDFQHSHWVCDPAKVREEIGFLPKTGIKEGIKWTADWYRIHRWL